MSQKTIVVKSLQLCEIQQKPRWGAKYPPVAGSRVKLNVYVLLIFNSMSIEFEELSVTMI